ncbi:MAG: glycosyltransferase family 9 protein [Candidatus Nanoarchaeia archaeon]
MQNYKKIIVLCLAGIGDGLLFIPTLNEIRKNFKQAKIDVLVMYKSTGEIIESSVKGVNIIYFDFIKNGKIKSISFMRGIRKEKYDLCITSYPANRLEYNVISYLTGAKERIAHDYFIGNYFLTARFLQTKLAKQNSKENGYMHNVEENLKILELLSIKKPKKPEIKIKINKKESRFAEEFLKKNKVKNKELLIGIHAGTGETKNLHLRRWPKERFAGLIDMLVEKKNAKILIFGGPNENLLKQEIKELAHHKENIILVNDTSMKQSMAIIKKCKVFVSNDSALMHVASALKIPVVAIFGPTNTKWVYPYNVKHVIVTKNMECSPCYFYSKMNLSCPKKLGFQCMKIEVIEVYNALKGLLD